MPSFKNIECYEFTAPVSNNVIDDPFVEIGDNHLAKLFIMQAGLYKYPALLIVDKVGDEISSNYCFTLVNHEIIYGVSPYASVGVLRGTRAVFLGTWSFDYEENNKVKELSFKLRKDYKEVCCKYVWPDLADDIFEGKVHLPL